MFLLGIFCQTSCVHIKYLPAFYGAFSSFIELFVWKKVYKSRISSFFQEKEGSLVVSIEPKTLAQLSSQ